MYNPFYGFRVCQTGGAVPATVDFDLSSMQMNVKGVPYPISSGARFAIVPLEFAAPAALNGVQQSAQPGALLQPVQMPVSLRYVAPSMAAPEARQSAGRYDTREANQYTLLAHSVTAPQMQRRDEQWLKASAWRNNEDSGFANRSCNAKQDMESETVRRSWPSRHSVPQRVGGDEVDGWSPCPPCSSDRDESDLAYVSRRECMLDANNNETSGFVEVDTASPIITPLASSSGDKQHRSAALSVVLDAQHSDGEAGANGHWDELGVSGAANGEVHEGTSERRRESTPIGPVSIGSESESESKRQELDGAIADVSAVAPDSPRSETDPVLERGGKSRRSRANGEPDISESSLSASRAQVPNHAWVNVHCAPWYPPGTTASVLDRQPLTSLRETDKENYLCPSDSPYDSLPPRADALDSFAADLKRGLPQSAPHGHHANNTWAYAAMPNTRPQPYSHARRNGLVVLSSQPYPYPHESFVQPQAPPKRIRLSASGAAALQLNNIDANRFSGLAPLYPNEMAANSQIPAAAYAPAPAPSHSNRPSNCPSNAPGMSNVGEDKVAANMKRLFTKILETFDGLTADDAISIIRQVKIKRNGLKGLTMKTILSDAIEIVKEMNAMAGAVQHASVTVSTALTQPHELAQLPSAPSWNGKVGSGERRGVISLARPAHEEPCLDVNCTDFLQYCKYKTELCAQQQAAGRCKMGAKCVYAHGPAELRPIRKLRMCNGMAKYGYCAYGDKCLWAHSEAELYHETLDDRLAWFQAGRPACLTIADAHRAPSMAPHPLGPARTHHEINSNSVHSSYEPVWNGPSQPYEEHRLAANGRARLSALQNLAPAPELRFAAENTARWCDPSKMQDMPDGPWPTANSNTSPCLICGCSLRLRRPRTIECGHEFHDDCIRRWAFTQDLSCPICGRAIAGLSDAPAAFSAQSANSLASR